MDKCNHYLEHYWKYWGTFIHVISQFKVIVKIMRCEHCDAGIGIVGKDLKHMSECPDGLVTDIIRKVEKGEISLPETP